MNISPEVKAYVEEKNKARGQKELDRLQAEVDKIRDARNRNQDIIDDFEDRDDSPDEQEEQKIASIIKNTVPDESQFADLYKEIIGAYLTSLTNKILWGGRTFNVGFSIKRTDYHSTNSEVYVHFEFDPFYDDPFRLAFDNRQNRMSYLMSKALKENNELYNDIYYYCQQKTYMQNNKASSDENVLIRKRFCARA